MLNKIITVSLIVMAIYTLYAVLTPNHLYVG